MDSGAREPVAEGLVDERGRALRDLRLSVTDRCNFRCPYCLPREGTTEFLPRASLLSFEELERVARSFVRLGVRKIRLTGGEPLLRRDLPKLVEKLARLDVDLALTTNGVLLPRLAGALRSAGLGRLTVSLDALDEEVFQRTSDAPDFGARDVLAGIEAARVAGFTFVKVNAVVRRGVNESEILPLARYFRGTGHVLRFIEYMDVGTQNGWQTRDVVPASEILARLAELGPSEPSRRAHSSDVAERHFFPDRGQGALEVGLVASVSAPFCGDCSRARVTADGRLVTCLFGARGLDVRAFLRARASDEELEREIARVWRARSDRHSELRHATVAAGAETATSPRRLAVLPRVEMSYVGG